MISEIINRGFIALQYGEKVAKEKAMPFYPLFVSGKGLNIK